MTTNFTRTMYDQDNLEMLDTNVKDQNKYIMNINSVENDSACHSLNGARNSLSQVSRPLNDQGQLDLSAKVDVESKLQNRHVELNSFDTTNKDYADIKLGNSKICTLNETFIEKDTRFSEGPSREKYTADYNFSPYVHMNPQNVVSNNDKFMDPSRYGVSTRHQFIEKNENKTKQSIISEQKKKDKNFNIFQGYLPTNKSNKDVPDYLQ